MSDSVRSGDLPTRSFASVVHVGTLHVADRASWSWEGDGVSVSVHPSAWVRIARLGGRPWWEVTSTDGGPLRFVDAHALTEEQRAAVSDWGLARGLVVRQRGWVVSFYDDEFDCVLSSVHDNETDALAEADGRDADVSPRDILVPGPAAAGTRGLEVGNVEDVLLTMWGAACVDDVVGVWFDDDLDPDRLSAPRGVVLADRLDRVRMSRRPG